MAPMPSKREMAQSERKRKRLRHRKAKQMALTTSGQSTIEGEGKNAGASDGKKRKRLRKPKAKQMALPTSDQPTIEAEDKGKNAGASDGKKRKRLRQPKAKQMALPTSDQPTIKAKAEAKEEDLRVQKKDVKSDEAVWDLYERWCTFYEMSRTPEEKILRFDSFKECVKSILETNKKERYWKAGLNHMSDLTEEEWNKRGFSFH